MKSKVRRRPDICFSLVACLLFSAGCSAAGTSCRANEQIALEAQVMAATNSVSNALSVLAALQKSDTGYATTLLHAQLKSNLTILYALSPGLQHNREIVEEALQEAEKYVRDHGLKVIKPEGRRETR